MVTEGDTRHPTDGEAKKEFNGTVSKFRSKIRNVRLGLETGGFNPFGTVGVSSSAWLVAIVPYNLPPSM